MSRTRRHTGPWLVVASVCIGLAVPCLEAQEPANPNTNQTARDLLRYIADLPNRSDNRVISGQRLSDFYGGQPVIPPTSSRPLDRIANNTGRWVGIASAEYTNWKNDPPDLNQRVCWPEINPVMIDHWNRGGIVELHFHPNSPRLGRLSDPDIDLDEVLNPGGAYHSVYMGILDQAVEGLRNLQDNGVVVLWRPIHGSGPGGFWWGGQAIGDHTRLWRHMFNYFTGRGLNNLLWVYSEYSGNGNANVYTDHFPGSSYCDIVGFDWYFWQGATFNDFVQAYDVARGLGKPIGMSQFSSYAEEEEGGTGNRQDLRQIINGIRSLCPRISYFIVFSTGFNFAGGSDPQEGIATNPFAQQLLDDPWVVNRDEISFRNSPPPPPPPPPPPGGTYLSDLPFASEVNGWGPAERDVSNGRRLYPGGPITLNGVVYSKGLGVHAYSEIHFSVGAAYTTFLSDIGVDDNVAVGASGCTVIFQVWGDGVLLFNSGIMTAGSPTQSVALDVTGVYDLALVVLDAGDGITSDEADWAGARLLGGGSPPPPPPPPPSGSGTGFTAEYYNGANFDSLVSTQIDPTIDFHWSTPDPSEFSVIWTGYLDPLYSEIYTFTTLSDDGVRLWVNGQLVIDHWEDHGSAWDSGSIALAAGQRVPIRMEYYKNGWSGRAQLYWSSASQPPELIPANRVFSSAVAGAVESMSAPAKSSNRGGCGATGVEALLMLGIVGLARRRSRN